MSAILGRINFAGGAVNRPQFQHALGAMAAYGGDGEAVAYGANYAFGLQYFRLKPGQTETPQLVRDGFVLTADGVIDARDDLLKALDLDSVQGEALSDFDLIRRAYLKWDVKSSCHLFGDYAFAAYDPSTCKLFLARDHIGKRPLYWTRQGDSFAFSSDISALLDCAGSDPDIDLKVLLRHMRQGFRPQSKALFDGIHFVSPGSYLIVHSNGQTETRWWDPGQINKAYRGSAQACVRDLRQILEAVTADHIDTDLPLGSHVSGGIDSGAVTALAAQRLTQEGRSLVSAYAWAPDVSEDFPDQGEYDERHNIRKICEKSGVPVAFSSTDYRTLEAFQQRPFEREGFANLSEELDVLDQASRAGVRILLSGWGGDEAFSAMGNDYFIYCLKRLRLIEAFRILKTISNDRRNPRVLLRNLYRFGLRPMLPSWLGGGLPKQVRHDDEPTSFINATFLDSDDGLRAWVDANLHRTDSPKMHLVNLQLYGHLAARMDTWANWSAACGIQYRYPLLDRRIMEFILTVPERYHFVDRAPRYLARASTQDLLPANLMKYDTVNEQLRWKLRFDYWKALAEEEKNGAFQGDSAWLDMRAVRAAIRHQPDKPTRQDMLTYRQLSLSIRVWYLERRYGTSPRTPSSGHEDEMTTDHYGSHDKARTGL